MNKSSYLDLSRAFLHILAMAIMLCDHSWATIFPGTQWLTRIGRIAFPIFAFLLVEGYFHTHNLRRYMTRLLAGAVISEIPFNYMVGGGPIYPYHQNVLWTFFFALLIVSTIDKLHQQLRPAAALAASAALAALGYLLGYVAMVDYYGLGILTVLVFYFFRERTWTNFALQFACLLVINGFLLGGIYWPVTVMGHEFELPQQGLALLALVPIWLYHGRQGYHNKRFQRFCYAFYPLHITVLCCISAVLSR